MIDARHRHATVAHGLGQCAEPTEIGDVEHEDGVGPAQLLHCLLRPIRISNPGEEKLEALRGREWD